MSKYYDYDDYDDDYDDYDDIPIQKPVAKKTQPAKTQQQAKSTSSTTKTTQASNKNVTPTKQNAPSQLKVGTSSTHSTTSSSSSSINYYPDFETFCAQELNLSTTSPIASLSSSLSSASIEKKKDAFTFVVVGHVDSGKSTLVGRLLGLLGTVNKRAMEKNFQAATALDKESFGYAFVTDELQSERERGVTIDVAEREISTATRSFTILDAPGHRDFVPNMIKGAAQADAALLVIPATEGEYETSMSERAQTREHAFLLKALGVNQIIVVINKMDKSSELPWSYTRYNTIKNEVSNFLFNELKYTENQVKFIPISGFTGENLIKLSDECEGKSWYSGPTLYDVLEHWLVFNPQNKINLSEKSFRASVRSIIESGTGANSGDSGALGAIIKKEFLIESTIIQGTVEKNDTVGLCHFSSTGVNYSSLIISEIKDNDGKDIDFAGARDKVTFKLVAKKNSTISINLSTGQSFLFKGPALPAPKTTCKVSLFTLPALPLPIIPGLVFEVYIYGIEIQGRITKLHPLNKGEKKPRCIGAGKQGKVTLSLILEEDSNPTSPNPSPLKNFNDIAGATVWEPFNTCRAFGRVALRYKGTTVAIGVVEEEKEKKDKNEEKKD